MADAPACRSQQLATRADRLVQELTNTLDQLGASDESSKVKRLVADVVAPVAHRAAPALPREAHSAKKTLQHPHRQAPRLNKQNLASRPPWRSACGLNALSKYSPREYRLEVGPHAAEQFMLRLELTMRARDRRAKSRPGSTRPWIPNSNASTTMSAFPAPASSNRHANTTHRAPPSPPLLRGRGSPRSVLELVAPSHRRAPVRAGNAALRKHERIFDPHEREAEALYQRIPAVRPAPPPPRLGAKPASPRTTPSSPSTASRAASTSVGALPIPVPPVFE